MCRVDPQATSEEVPDTPLEIAAMNENTEAFELLAPHYEEETKKNIAQLLIWGLTDQDPDAEFKMLFQSVPLAEVMLKYHQQCERNRSGEQLPNSGVQLATSSGKKGEEGPCSIPAGARVT